MLQRVKLVNFTIPYYLSCSLNGFSLWIPMSLSPTKTRSHIIPT